jgi:tRNA G18 (ribose-2'-O)-methylase SpoU
MINECEHVFDDGSARQELSSRICDDGQVVRFTTIEAADDERLRPYTHLTDAQHRRGVEGSTQTFVVEGTTAIRAALASTYRVRSVLVTPAKLAALAPDLEQHPELTVFVSHLDVMKTVVGFNIHRGAAALAERRPLPAPETLLVGARTLVVLEGINDHENLGALARSARALGVDAFLLDPTCADPLYRRCVRVSLGHVLHVPFTRTAAGPAALRMLERAGFTTIALTPAPSAPDVDALAAALGQVPVALVIGSEARGLTAATLAAAGHRARVPMRPGVDSLNVGHAAAIAFHVFGRDRS